MGATESRMDHRRYHVRDSFSHRHPDEDDCDVSIEDAISEEDRASERTRKVREAEELEAFLLIHIGMKDRAAAALARRNDRISSYLIHHGFLQTAPSEDEQLRTLARLYGHIPLFCDIYADALFQSGSSLKLNYTTPLAFKPDYTTEYIFLVIALYLPTIAKVVERYGHRLHHISNFRTISDVQNEISSFSRRGGTTTMVLRAAMTECAPDILRGYPALPTQEFINRNVLITRADAFISPSDFSSALEFKNCTFRYSPDRNFNKWVFVMDKLADKSPVKPNNPLMQSIPQKPAAVPPMILHPPLPVKLKRNAFPVYSQRKYDNPAPSPVKLPVFPDESRWDPEPKIDRCREIEKVHEVREGPPLLQSSLLRSPEVRIPSPPPRELDGLRIAEIQIVAMNARAAPGPVPVASRDTEPLKIDSPSDQEDDTLTCPICMDSRREQVLGCGHFLCEECSDVKSCPFCRSPVVRRIKVFWS